MENARVRAILELRKVERSGTIVDIRSAIAKVDGIHTIFDVLDGLRQSEGKKPFAGGLIRRILSLGERNGTEGR